MGVREILLVLVLIAVVLILVSGLYSFAHDDESQRATSNMWMRMRVIAQGVAVALIALLVYTSD